MQRREDQMPRQRGLDGDLGRFQIPDLSDHDDIRVLTENSTQTIGESEVRLGVDLDLAYPRETVFHRVFDSDDILVRSIEYTQ